MFKSSDQWSVTNQNRKKVYSKLLLVQLGNEPVCQKKPIVLNYWDIITKVSNVPNCALGVSIYLFPKYTYIFFYLFILF